MNFAELTVSCFCRRLFYFTLQYSKTFDSFLYIETEKNIKVVLITTSFCISMW